MHSRASSSGMGAGLPKHVIVNLDDLEKHFNANDEVTLEAVREKVLTVSGRDRKLPLKVLGNGKLTKPLKIHAAAFSASAKEAIAAAGGSIEEVAGRNTWTKKAHKALVAKMKEEGLDHDAEMSKKRAARAIAKGRVSKSRLAKGDKPKPRKTSKSAKKA